MKKKNKGMLMTVIPLNPEKKKFHIIKKFVLNNIVRRHTRTITKRYIGRLYGMTCDDLDEVRIAKAEHEGKTPLIWVDLAFWSLRRHRETRNGRLTAFRGKLCWLLRHTMPMINR